MSNHIFQCREFQSHNSISKQRQEANRTTSLTNSKKIVDQKNISEDDQFEPQYHTMKKLKLPINRKRLSKGNWTLQENKIYLGFLIHNKASFIDEATRRQERVFCRLSELLNKKRTPDQCRSHHQKLISNLNNSIEDLILKIEKKIENRQASKAQDPCKIEFREILPLKIQEEAHKDTGLPKCNPNKQAFENGNGRDREVEMVIERDFYKLSLLRSENTFLVQISEQEIKSY